MDQQHSILSNGLDQQQETSKTINEPIIQLKESSSSSSSSQLSDSEQVLTPCESRENLNKLIETNSGSADSEDGGSGSGSREVSSRTASRTSSRIVKRRLIRTRQTRQHQQQDNGRHNVCSHKEEQVTNSADIEEQKQLVSRKENTREEDTITNTEQNKNKNNNNSNYKINSFFRTRQIGGYQTSSSKTSIKTHTSKSSTVTKSSQTKQSSQDTNNNSINSNNNNINININNNNNNNISLSSLSTVSTLERSASKRHIAQATSLSAGTNNNSKVMSNQEEQKFETETSKIISLSKNQSAIISSNNNMTNNSNALSGKLVLPSSTRASPDLSHSSFPFEIERVMPSPELGASQTGSQVTEAAESLVSHRESFSQSTSSSLRGSANVMAASAAATASASANFDQQMTASRHQKQQVQMSTSNSLTSNSSMGSTIKAVADHRVSAASSTISSSSTRSSSAASHLNKQLNESTAAAQRNQLFSTSSQLSQSHHLSHHHHQEHSASASLSSRIHHNIRASDPSQISSPFQIFVSSPDVRSLAQEIGTDFAKLESCLTRPEIASQNQHHHGHHLIGPSHLFSSKAQHNNRLFNHQLAEHQTHILGDFSRGRQFSAAAPLPLPAPPLHEDELEEERQKTSAATTILNGTDSIGRTNRIRELLSKANNPNLCSPIIMRNNNTNDSHDNNEDPSIDERVKRENEADREQKQRSSAAMNESIVRIEHKLSDICKKLDDCQDLKQAIELLEVLIQMIEKAWSVPVCGDDLGFRLCSSLRISGGLAFILGLIFDAHNTSGFLSSRVDDDDPDEASDARDAKNDDFATSAKNTTNRNQLRLNLPDSHTFEETITLPAPPTTPRNTMNDSINGDSNLNSPTLSGPRSPLVEQSNNNNIIINNNNTTTHFIIQAKDSDSEILTSDLGLDSASVESFSYANTNSNNNNNNINNNNSNINANNNINPERRHESQNQSENEIENEDETNNEDLSEKALEAQRDIGSREAMTSKKLKEESLQRDELIFLSARLLSQCLTTDNRDYLVREGWLEPVVKLACRLAMIKSGQAHRKLLLATSKCVLTRQSSTVSSAQAARLKLRANMKDVTLKKSAAPKEDNNESNGDDATNNDDDSPKEEDQQADLLASIGTEILQHLFKHSEDTCTTIISMGGLEAILFGCRSSCVETLRHCAPALANLALHGGPSAHELMIEHKAHVWLFPLAFNEDDNVQYYACLAIVTLVANQEIEADVLKSSTLNLVEPFVTSHEPRKFAESNTAHIHGQSASWLRRLIPLLSSKREEARNLAAFHLAMEAYVKREQAQSHIFREIDVIEPLKKLAGSPNAIASKFACQALRLIGEQVPHRLSQQVALWTSEDVIQWVCQIGFAQFEQKFHDSGVDGDLLLQLDEQMLERDIGIKNGITRRRFLRELSQLKKISDYSSLDRTNLCAILGSENLQYAYAMLKFGVTRDNICHLDADHLLEECGIPNTIHRKILSQTIRSLQDKMALQAQAAADQAQNGLEAGSQKTLDVFVSYRRSTGSQLASLLKVHLQLRNFSVFIDVERLEAGKFDNNLLDSIKQARNFILVLSPNALDRCIDDFECKDWVHKEIVAALSSDCNIIPIMDNFSFPDPEKLPEDMRSVLYYNGVPWIHDYQDACVDKIERFIRGEVNKVNGLAGFMASSTSALISGSATGAIGQSQMPMTNSSQHSNCGSLKRHFNQFASPTPSSINGYPAITPLMSQHQQQQYSDYSHPLASAINYNNNDNNNCQQQATCQNLFQHQQQLTNFNSSGNKR